ncbi:hypothetical protein, partial [Salmonella enterica]|uniref:hypothetical protein n=1 Tax=Salmonella enterica TaxID=28901 RepID=UPI003F755592
LRPYCAASFITIAGDLSPIIASTSGNAPEGENIAPHFTLLERLSHKPGLTSRYRSCESVSLKGLSKGLILRIFVSDRNIGWSRHYRTEMAPNQTTNFAGYAGKTRHTSGKIFTLTY